MPGGRPRFYARCRAYIDLAPPYHRPGPPPRTIRYARLTPNARNSERQTQPDELCGLNIQQATITEEGDVRPVTILEAFLEAQYLRAAEVGRGYPVECLVNAGEFGDVFEELLEHHLTGNPG